MTQRVFSNSMVAHVWANQGQDSGRSHNGNFYFEGPSIYSYGTHYCAGYIAPGGVYLVNGEDSTMTTKGKHLNAVWRALDYGRGKFANCHTVPDLTGLARKIQSLAFERGRDKTAAERRAAVPQLAAYLESCGKDSWPGIEAATALFRGMGATPAEAERRAKAGAERVARAERKAAEAEARKELESNAGLAKHFAKHDPAETGAEVRDKLCDVARHEADRVQWQAKESLAEAVELSREPFRAAKAAKAKGWPRIAAACRAHHKAARAELKRFERTRERYAMRAELARNIRAIRAFDPGAFWRDNPMAAEGVEVPRDSLPSAVAACERGAKAFRELAACIGHVTASAYAVATWPLGTLGRARKAHNAAHDTAEALAARAGALRVTWQAEAAAMWRDTGARPPYSLGQLADVTGGALLRAKDVTRDESGAISGGTLQTSWGAEVPLVHAVRAFRFLKLCRAKGDGWQANGRTLRVGHFRIDRVTASGDFTAGCHRINWGECQRLAEALGIAELAESAEALA